MLQIGARLEGASAAMGVQHELSALSAASTAETLPAEITAAETADKAGSDNAVLSSARYSGKQPTRAATSAVGSSAEAGSSEARAAQARSALHTVPDGVHATHQFKIILLGDCSVGKSSLLTRFVDDSFSMTQHTTTGVDYKTRTVAVGSAVIKLVLWDTAGQERFRSLTSSFYGGANGIV